MSVRCRYSFGVLLLGLCSVATHTFAKANSEVPPTDIHVTLLRTASGPPRSERSRRSNSRFGASI